MGIVYRYTDLSDETIKYIGIVWSGNRTLKQRVAEHARDDEWCKQGAWRIEYLKRDIASRTDAEMLEAHYIAKYGTDEHFNTRKKGWGTSDILDDKEDKWELFSTDEEQVSDLCWVEPIKALSYDSWHRDVNFVGEKPLLTLESESATFLFPHDDMLSLELRPCGENMSPCYLGVNMTEFLVRYLKHLGYEDVDDLLDRGEIAISRSEVTGDIDCFGFVGDNDAILGFHVEKHDKYDNVYTIHSLDRYSTSEISEVVSFIQKAKLSVYDWIDDRGDDYFYNMLVEKAIKTGHLG